LESDQLQSSINIDIDMDVAIIACNNELTIARTIESIKHLASRIIVVDSGSTDRTIDIATQLGAEAIHHDWEGHVKQKQFALEKCTATWVLSLDSDEAPDEELLSAITSAVKQDNPRVAGYEMNRRIFFLGRWLNHTFQPEYRLRLVRRTSATWTGYDPHDKLIITTPQNGKIERLPAILRHDSWQDVASLLRNQISHGLNAAESYHRLNRRAPFLKLCISPPATLFKQLILRLAFLDGWRGILVALAASIGVTAKYMRLIELIHHNDDDRRKK